MRRFHHGTNLKICDIDLSLGRPRTDFGKGFSRFSLSAEPRHSFDIVYGPIANDKIADVVDEYIDGVITAEEAIGRAMVLPSAFQMSFHTPLALSFVKQELTEYQQQTFSNKWSEWKKA